MYHGSPYSGIKDFGNVKPPVFFTQNLNVAKEYAKGQVVMTGHKPNSDVVSSPTIYVVDVDASNSFDMRNEEHKNLYEKLRLLIVNANPNDQEIKDDYPSIKSNKFIMSNSRLPSYAYIRPIMSLIKDNFDSVWVDEGTQGVSLGFFKPQGKIKIISTEELK